MYYEDVTGLDLQTEDEFILEIPKDQETDQDYQGDIIVCLSCSHLAHYHHDKVTGEQTDTCSKPECPCQSYEPEICN